MELDRDFSEFVALFARHEVRFLIVGGYALAAHGLPRATGDLDAWIWTDPGNARKIVAALEEFGFGGLGLTVDDMTQSGTVIQLGYPPHRIDLLTSINGVEFADAWDRRVPIVLDGVEVPFISRDDLIMNKSVAAHPQDLVDVERLIGHGKIEERGPE